MTLTDDGLKALRGEIVLAAKASIESITRETGRGAGQGPLNPHLNHKLLTIIAHGRDALSDLDFFWGHPLLYSKEQYSSYLSASLILLKENRSPPQSYECREFGSLENFYEDFNNNDLSQGCRGTLCILGRRNRALELQESLFSLKRKVPFSTICKSGAVLFLLLAKTLFGVSSPDIYDLVQTILGEDRREQKRKISSLSNSGRLPQLSEEEVYLSGACQETPSAERPTWSTFKHNYPDIPHQCCTSSSTKKLSFPLGLPKYQTDSRHVDIHQPHSEVPTSDVHCAIWGFQSEKANPWKCIVSVSQHRFARTLKDNIHHLLRNDSDNSPHLLQNWTNCIEYIYKLGINDSRLAIREALGELESMRYSNGAKPKAASAHICLMLINFFTFYSQLSLALGEEVGTFPEDWGLASIPTWVNDIEKRCPVLADECTFVSEEAKAVRTLNK
ncbi:hypothetical protein FQN50_009460 [Emmonsiellopsis sp. PD_5]|nr:hypothetical protein FQN50_009460 [Emmonsiellopsis sp. PD_5]